MKLYNPKHATLINIDRISKGEISDGTNNLLLPF